MQHILTFDEFSILCQSSETFREFLWTRLSDPVDILQIVRDTCDGIMESKIGCIKRVRETFTIDFIMNHKFSLEELAAAAGVVTKVDTRGIGLLAAKKLVEKAIDFPCR